MNAEEITRLLSRIALDDRAAFAHLYTLTSAKLFGVSLRILKDRALAEDVLQEAYVKIWRKASSFKPGQNSAMSWLIAVTRHQAIDRLRASQSAFGALEEAKDVVDPAADQETEMVRRDERMRIDACLEELDAERASAVREAYVEGFSYQELAERYDTPLNTMRTWLRRSLIQLRRCLER